MPNPFKAGPRPAPHPRKAGPRPAFDFRSAQSRPPSVPYTNTVFMRYPIRSFLFLCLAIAAAGSAFAAGKIFPYAYTQEDLPNGLRLITIPTDYPNIVSLYIVVGAGSRDEVEPGKTGFAHLFEHLMFRGTAEYPAEKYTSTLQNAGAASNAYTSSDLTAYHTTFSKEDLPLMLSMEADRFQHLDYSEATFKTETQAVLGEYNKNSANP